MSLSRRTSLYTYTGGDPVFRSGPDPDLVPLIFHYTDKDRSDNLYYHDLGAKKHLRSLASYQRLNKIIDQYRKRKPNDDAPQT